MGCDEDGLVRHSFYASDFQILNMGNSRASLNQFVPKDLSKESTRDI
jgi:hypothetical protein